jgi:hypothetical protein
VSTEVRTRPPNKGMKLTSVERIERSQLIPGVRRLQWVERQAAEVRLWAGEIRQVPS